MTATFSGSSATSSTRRSPWPSSVMRRWRSRRPACSRAGGPPPTQRSSRTSRPRARRMSIRTLWSMARWSRRAPGPTIRAGCGRSFVFCKRRRRYPRKRLPASAKTTTTSVYLESSRTRTFACAYDWPGWCRSGKDEASALAALAAYAPRYAPVAKHARLRFGAHPADRLRVVERLAGPASTDFGVPATIAKRDTTPLAAAEGKRLAALVHAAWAVYDRILASAPAELRKGPRGGGRDRDKIADHVLAAEGAYVRKLGLRLSPPAKNDRSGLAAFRAAITGAIAQPSTGA